MSQLILYVFIFLSSLHLYAGTWSTAQTINQGASNGVDDDASLVYNPSDQTIMATWGDWDNGTPYYTIWNGSSWSTAQPITEDFTTVDNVSLIYNPLDQTIMAAWGDESSANPYYTIWNGSSWETAQPITEDFTTGDNVSLIYNPFDQTIMAAWSDWDPDGTPYYSIWNGSWSTAQTIDQGDSNGADYNVSLVYNPSSQTIMAAWGDWDNETPYYTIWNGSSWETAQIIDQGDSSGVDYDVTLVYNSSNQTIMAAWGDGNIGTPYYTIWNGSWPAAQTIASTGSVEKNVSLVYNSFNQTIVAAWGNTAKGIKAPPQPVSSTFSQTGWSAVQSIPVGTSSGVNSGVSLVYNQKSQTIMAAWGDSDGETPYYSILTGLGAPQNLSGSQKKNNFGLSYELFNVLQWQPNPSYSAAGYNIYRNDVKIATVSPSTFSYEDHNRQKREPDTYAITAFISSSESDPATVTVP